MPITDQEIERLGNAANDCLKPHGYLTAEHFNTVANPSTILSLIERVKQAEKEVAQLRKEVARRFVSIHIDSHHQDREGQE